MKKLFDLLTVAMLALVACDPKPSISVDSVSVDPTSVTLLVGETKKLTATVIPSDAPEIYVTWTSDTPAVAEVNNFSGVVTAIAPGNARITATTSEGGKTATCTVTILQGATGIEISARELTIELGKTAPLTATVLPANAHDKTLVVTNSAPAVASWDPATGTVTALSIGQTTITVTTEQGGLTASCVVFVTAATDPEDVLTMIPDPAFRAYIESSFVSYDSDGNGKLSLEEAAEWDMMWIRENSGIVSLSGIEHFTGLTELHCLECPNLTSLDVSGLASLTIIECRDTKLITSLDVSGLTELTQLTCGNSQLTSLDLSDCSSLISLACGNNQLTSLDVSGFTALEFLYGQHNQLTSLDLSGCSALKHLDCADNRLVSLDISDCTGLTSLYNFFNPGRSGQFLISAWFSWNPANGAGSFPAQLSEAVTGLNVDWPYYGSGTVSARFVNVRP